jgi:hypothetical protein
METPLSPADPHFCVDLIPVRQPTQSKLRATLVKAFMWQAGDVITASFLDGDPGLQARVRKVAQSWSQYVNVKFQFSDGPNADIRISFSQGPGSWSLVGTQCRTAPVGSVTMNYGWLKPESDDLEVQRVVLHEFGHALGLIHEHQNPAGGIQWNKPVVYAYLQGPPNNWTPEKVDRNMFQLYQEDLTVHTKVDAQSIMMYAIPAQFTLDGYSAGINTTLSDIDKSFMSEMYPF